MKHRKPLHNIDATVAYGDIFDYPLTREELSRWSISGVSSVSSVGIEEKKGFFVLRGRARIIALRKQRAHIAQAKWKRIAVIAWVFRLIPTVTLVGVTGGLAMNNARIGDDIDLFLVTRSGTLWVTRMMVTLLAESLRLRRRPNDQSVKDKICLNMFVSEDSLALPLGERDLFSAHEVLQMVPLWERGGVYSKFLAANRWVKDYLPNAWKEKASVSRITYHVSRNWIEDLVIWILGFAELPCKAIQLRYMKKRRTNEVIRSGMIRFHPRDARVWVRKKFGARLKRWNIPLDKFFFCR